MLNSLPVASTPAVAAAAVSHAEPEPVRADGSDKYYGMENVSFHISHLNIHDELTFSSLATLGTTFNA